MTIERQSKSQFFSSLKLHGKHGRGWSGDIPLHRPSKNIPWLVKGTFCDKLKKLKCVNRKKNLKKKAPMLV